MRSNVRVPLNASGTQTPEVCAHYMNETVCSGAQKKMQPCIVNSQPAVNLMPVGGGGTSMHINAHTLSAGKEKKFQWARGREKQPKQQRRRGRTKRFVAGMCLFILKSHKYTHNPNSFRVIYCPRSHKEIWKRCCCFSGVRMRARGVPPRG